MRAVDAIGWPVFKPSGKPFKSGSKVNHVKGLMWHPFLENAPCFTFVEDDSYVEVKRCRLADDFDVDAFDVTGFPDVG